MYSAKAGTSVRCLFVSGGSPLNHGPARFRAATGTVTHGVVNTLHRSTLRNRVVVPTCGFAVRDASPAGDSIVTLPDRLWSVHDGEKNCTFWCWREDGLSPRE